MPETSRPISDIVEADRAAAQAVIANRHATSTLDAYRNAFNRMESYARDHGFADEAGKLPIPVPDGFITAFVGHLSQLRDNGTLYSDSYVGHYSSSLVYYYGEKQLILPDEIRTVLSQFKRGHKRKIADLRNNGTYDVLL